MGFKVGIITVPSRLEIVKDQVQEFESKGLEVELFIDYDYKGQPFNYARMLDYYCHLITEDHIILCTDDIILNKHWYGLLKVLFEETDYDIICGFTNKGGKANDVYNLRRADTPYALYDTLLVFRNGVLNEDFYEGVMAHSIREDIHKKEVGHFDNVLSSYLYFNNYKCGITRPNLIKLKDVPSTLGHSIVDRELIENESD